MLEAFKSKNASSSRLITVVGPGTAVNGRLTSTGSIRVEGRVSGLLQSEAEVMVLPSGQVLADISAQNIIISGEVEGDITASDRLEITRGARVVGNISAPRIHIDESVVFEGRCTMHAPDRPPVETRPAARDVRDTETARSKGKAKGKGKSALPAKHADPKHPATDLDDAAASTPTKTAPQSAARKESAPDSDGHVSNAPEISPGGFYTRDPNRQFPLEQPSDALLPLEEIELLRTAADLTDEASTLLKQNRVASQEAPEHALPRQGQLDVGDVDDGEGDDEGSAADSDARKPE